jgi:CRP-like cAMP-binding protein
LFFSEYPEEYLDKGEILIKAGESPKGIWYLEKGIVEEYELTPEGTKVIVNVFKAGSYFPMSWALNKTHNRYYFAAHTHATIRTAPVDIVIIFLRENPDILLELMARVFRGTDALLRRLVLATSSASSKRLMYELLLESERFGKEIGDGQKQINIKQNVLAARCGLARETVSRELQQLEKAGYILRYKQGIVINTRRIEHALDFAYDS